MPKARSMKKQFHALRYHGGARNNSVAKAQYLAWRRIQDPPLPERCDNFDCRYFSEPLIWNNAALPLILEHTNGVNTDNSPVKSSPSLSELRLTERGNTWRSKCRSCRQVLWGFRTGEPRRNSPLRAYCRIRSVPTRWWQPRPHESLGSAARPTMTPNPSIERTVKGVLRTLSSASHLIRSASQHTSSDSRRPH